ncbi:MAG: zinc-ribbon domain-containing protein [Clostridiaceae bacterium]|nr:zinc-ribbon domain-containing protein [Clostridiaceae bacterium]
MKSIKPGRGPSGLSFIGSVIAIIFGVFWTIIAFIITSHASFGIIGLIFPLFGILFIVMGVVQAAYHYKNATGKDRFSIYDITDRSEEQDPAERWIKNDYRDNYYESYGTRDTNEQQMSDTSISNKDMNYCPYCGKSLNEDFSFCPKCGKRLN